MGYYKDITVTRPQVSTTSCLFLILSLPLPGVNDGVSRGRSRNFWLGGGEGANFGSERNVELFLNYFSQRQTHVSQSVNASHRWYGKYCFAKRILLKQASVRMGGSGPPDPQTHPLDLPLVSHKTLPSSNVNIFMYQTQSLQLSTWRDQRLNQLSPTYLILIDPWIKFKWPTWKFRLGLLFMC